MTKYVLVSDNTLLYDYRNFPLLDFLPAVPVQTLPKFIYEFLRGKMTPATESGELRYAPYGLRKVEASLLWSGISPTDVAIAHPEYLDRFIKDDTEVIAVHTMDPFGLGPTTMSYTALMNAKSFDSYVRLEWESLIARINKFREGKKAKLLIGGPGVWEYTILQEEISRHKVDYLFQGEADDVAAMLFQQIAESSIDKNTFPSSYVTYDESFHRMVKDDARFLSRGPSIGFYPPLEKIPNIIKPTTKGLNEVMRGCGIGCDFCEVTLRPLRYYPVSKVMSEISVNTTLGGFKHAWVHSDEIFAYKHQQNYVPDEDALIELFTGIMSVKGVTRTNPTHGRISIPAAYPDLIKRLSDIMHAGPSNWAGIQVGLETGSEKLAKMHMPAKTLPLKIGVDGSWQEIVWKGVYNFNKFYWRPAFTVQVGQSGETDEDNWDTVAMINRLSNSNVDGRPFEFTITPLYNMPLGRIKAKQVGDQELSKSMLAVYYASHRHLAKIAARDSRAEARGSMGVRATMDLSIHFGGWLAFKTVENIARKAGLDIEKVKTYGIGSYKHIESWSMISNVA